MLLPAGTTKPTGVMEKDDDRVPLVALCNPQISGKGNGLAFLAGEEIFHGNVRALERNNFLPGKLGTHRRGESRKNQQTCENIRISE